MISPSFRLSLLGKNSKFRITLALSLVCILLVSAIANALETTQSGDSYIKVSKFSDRSNSVPLNGAVVSGNIYIHLSDRTINSAMYFLDTNGNYNNKLSITSMKSYPQDFQYRHSDGTPRAFDTKSLQDGKHTLAVRTRNTKTNTYTMRIAYFVVRNNYATTTTTQPVATTTSKPSTTTTTIAPTTTRPPISFTTFAGDVSPGKIRWGSASGGNGDPVARHGSELGNRIGLRRTFWRIDQKSSLVNTARSDIAAGRVPWVSIKLTGTWKENADGKYDAQMLALLNELSALPGPVWFTVHHEPEGGGCKCGPNGSDEAGGAPEWLRMQENTSKLIKGLRAEGKAKNIAFSSILMGWTFQSQSGRNPNEWYKDGIWDFAGLDAYASDEQTTSPAVSNGIPAAREFYGKRGLKLALGEWAFRTQKPEETNAGEVPSAEEERLAAQRMQTAYRDFLATGTDGKGSQIIGAAYFDTSINSGPASFEMTGSQLSTFRDLIVLPTSIKAFQT